jgi:hypothetical protein
MTLGLGSWGSEASVASGTLTGSNPPQPVRPAASGSEPLVDPLVGGSLELMAPRLVEGLGRPRLFAHVDLSAAVGFTYDVAKEGVPDAMVPPTAPTPESAVLGQGSKTEAEFDPLVASSGAGLAFTSELGGWRFRVKPSFEYIRQEIQLTGVVNRAVSLQPSLPATTSFRFIRLEGRRTKAYHGIGPGLELELDAGRVSPFAMTVFVSGQAYKWLGDLDLGFTDTFTDATGTESASWSFRSDGWLYRGALGVRFRWVPSGRR